MPEIKSWNHCGSDTSSGCSSLLVIRTVRFLRILESGFNMPAQLVIALIGHAQFRCHYFLSRKEKVVVLPQAVKIWKFNCYQLTASSFCPMANSCSAYPYLIRTMFISLWKALITKMTVCTTVLIPYPYPLPVPYPYFSLTFVLTTRVFTVLLYLLHGPESVLSCNVHSRWYAVQVLFEQCLNPGSLA